MEILKVEDTVERIDGSGWPMEIIEINGELAICKWEEVDDIKHIAEIELRLLQKWVPIPMDFLEYLCNI